MNECGWLAGFGFGEVNLQIYSFVVELYEKQSLKMEIVVLEKLSRRAGRGRRKSFAFSLAFCNIIIVVHSTL